MKVKVQCNCGAKFEFDVEPVNGRMPVSINCPVCNADATELANAIIAQQSAAPAPLPAPGLRIAKSHSEHVAPAPVPQPETPAAHPASRIPRPASRSTSRSAPSPVFAKLITTALTLLILAFLGLWFWYAWFGRNPKVVYTVTFGQSSDSPEQVAARPFEFYKLIAPGRLLSIKNNHAILTDVSKNDPLWSTPLKTDSDNSADAGISNPFVAATINDIWIAFPSHLFRLDRQTGAAKDTPVHGQILNISQRDDFLTVAFIAPDATPTLARVNLSDGTAQTTPFAEQPAAKPAPKMASDKKPSRDRKHGPQEEPDAEAEVDAGHTVTASTGSGYQSGMLAATHGSITVDPSEYLGDPSYFDWLGEQSPSFAASGAGVVELQTRLLEQKTVTHEAMKPQGKSVLDGTVTASQGLDLTQEMANNAQREQTGGVEIEDVSRYQVTLHRVFSSDTPDWAGEVTGPPRILPLKTLDLLVAGQSVTAFDHNNKKLWDGKLSYPMIYTGTRPPVLETADSVYVADAGVLNCFDLATGAIRWRLNSVGISSVLAGDRGNVYVNSTTAGPDKIKYSQEHNIREKIHPVIMSVDSRTGKVLWHNESIGNACVMSGKFLYSTWATQTQSAYRLEEGPDVHFYIDLLNPANGQSIWYHPIEGHSIVRVDVQQNWILLRFTDKLYVLKFFSL